MHKSQAWLSRYYRFDAVHHLWRPDEAGASDPAAASGIEERLLRIVQATFDRSSMSLEFQAGADDGVLDQHLSPRRANLLRPLGPLLRGTILEIGAGSGALTRFLGETATEVVAVEENAALAAVAEARCADLANVSVVADAFADLPSLPGFDVVTLVSLPGSARQGQLPGEPVAVKIRRARSFLRPGGILIMAIENRPGLDFGLDGAEHPADPISARADVEGRSAPASTSARADFARCLAEAGLSYQQWWFPQPDAIAPTSLLSDRAIAHEAELFIENTAPVAADGWKKRRTPALDRGLTALLQNRLWPDVAGSFLVVSSAAPLPDHDVMAMHYGRPPEPSGTDQGRGGERSATVVVQRRRPVLALPAVATMTDASFVMPRSLHDELLEIVGKAGWTLDDWSAWFRRWLQAVLAEAGEPIDPLPPRSKSLPGVFADAIPRRMMVGGDGLVRFQGSEWQLERPFEIAFLAYRGLFDSLDALGDCAEPKAGVPLRKMAIFQHLIRSIGWEMSADDLRHHVVFEGRIAAEISGGEQRSLSSLHDPIAIGVVSGGLRPQAEATLARELAKAEADAARLANQLVVLKEDKQSALSYAARIELELEQEKLANSEARREIAALTAAGEYLLRHLRRAYSKPWHPVRQGLQRIGLRALLLLERLMPSRTARSLRKSLQKRRPSRFQLEWELARTMPPPGLPYVEQLRASEEHDIALISASGLFDPDYYAGTAEARSMGLSPIAHYVRFGETRGLAPSAAFDPAFYGRLYPDITGSKLSHYLAHGRTEGRRPFPTARTLRYPQNAIDANRRTIIVLVHEASRTGAPILAWNIVREAKRRYNVVVVLKRSGVLDEAFESAASAVVTLPTTFFSYEAEFEALAEELIRHYKPDYVIANSVETRGFVPSFERNGVPTVALVHEFSTAYRPAGQLFGLFEQASQVVFPAQVVADAALADHNGLVPRRYQILPQGSSEVPPATRSGETGAIVRDARILTRPGLPEQGDPTALPPRDGTLFVVGMGTITMRKGVDVFAAAAADVVRRRPDLDITFAWAGEAYNFDQAYVDAVDSQIERSGLRERFRFLGAFSDLDPLYSRTDVMVLSSRLDPLPNVSIDSALRGIPVLCFENASGMAEILLQHEATRRLVVPYLNPTAIADEIIALATDSQHRQSASRAIAEIAAKTFDMRRYVERIDALAQDSMKVQQRHEQDHDVIREAGMFNATLYQPADVAQISEDQALDHYLLASSRAVPRGAPWSGHFMRRPKEGFNPLVYAAENAAFDEATGEDPLAHFVRNGQPAGPWLHTVIRPSGSASVTGGMRIAVHGHFHYVELLPEFLDRLGRNKRSADLLLTTTSDARRIEIERILKENGIHDAPVIAVPNKGRDIGPFLSAFPREQILAYDLIGHFHGKRSPHAGNTLGEVWRTFLWEHLIGGDFAMLDEIAAAFEADPKLGLVFPEDPLLSDWSDNREIADGIAAKMGVTLTNHFDFPIGTMFWARPAALAPMFDLNLTWDDYPGEPLPIDGTLLHVLERMLPFTIQKAGYQYATTYLRDHRR